MSCPQSFQVRSYDAVARYFESELRRAARRLEPLSAVQGGLKQRSQAATVHPFVWPGARQNKPAHATCGLGRRQGHLMSQAMILFSCPPRVLTCWKLRRHPER
jgi:hypothetical protein